MNGVISEPLSASAPPRASAWTVPTSMATGALSTDGTNPSTPAIDTTGANLLVAAVGRDMSCAVYDVFQDNYGNTWVLIASEPNPSPYGVRMDLFCAADPGLLVGPGHIFRPGSSQCGGTPNESYASVIVQGVVCNLSSTIGLDQASVGNSPNTETTVQAGAISPVYPDEIVFSSAGMAIAAGTWLGIDSGYTVSLALGQSDWAYGSALGYLIQTAAALTNPTWSYGPAGYSAAVNASFYFPPGPVTDYEYNGNTGLTMAVRGQFSFVSGGGSGVLMNRRRRRRLYVEGMN